MKDMCQNNTMMDVTTVNEPEIFNEKSQNTWVYAAYLPAGHHHFLLYCPATKRVFC